MKNVRSGDSGVEGGCGGNKCGEYFGVLVGINLGSIWKSSSSSGGFFFG